MIYIHAGDRTRFAAGRPGTVFPRFAGPPIAAVGIELDRKLANLLEALDFPPGAPADILDPPAVTR